MLIDSELVAYVTQNEPTSKFYTVHPGMCDDLAEAVYHTLDQTVFYKSYNQVTTMKYTSQWLLLAIIHVMYIDHRNRSINCSCMTVSQIHKVGDQLRNKYPIFHDISRMRWS